MKLPLFLYKTNYHGRALKEFSKGDFSGVPASCKLFTIGPLLLPPPGLLLAGQCLTTWTWWNWHFNGDSHQSPNPLVSGWTPKGGTTERQVQSRGPDGAGDLQPGDKWHEKSDSSLLAVGDVVIKLNFNSDFEQKILKIKFRQDFEAKIWSLFCFWLEDVYWSLNNKYFRREGLLHKNWIYNLCESRTKKKPNLHGGRESYSSHLW